MTECLKVWCSSVQTTITNKLELLKDCPYELYVNFCLKFGEAYGYFALSQILVIYLHEEYGVSDIHAGMVYGFWGACITFWGFITSCFNDYLGVRRSLLIGFSISMISNICLALNQNLQFFYIILFGLLPIGNSIGIPMLTVGIKRYTTKKNRGFAYGLFYAVMNIAALASGPVVDFFNVIVCPSGSSCSSTYRHDLTTTNSTSTSVSESSDPTRLITGNRLVIWSVVLVYFLAWVTTFLFLREIRVDDKDEERENDDLEQHSEESRRRLDSLQSDSTHELLASGPSLEGESQSFLSSPNPSFSSSSMALHQRKKKHDSPTGTVSIYSSLHVIPDAAPSSFSPVAQEEIELTLYPHDKATLSTSLRRKQHPAENQYLKLENPVEDIESQQSSKAFLSPSISSTSAVPETDPTQSSSSIRLHSPPKITSAYSYALEIVTTLTFWRFCLLTLFLINLNTIFRHVDATLPTYLLRCFGANYPKGLIYSINPMMIIWLTPTVAAFTSHWPHFEMIKYGGYVSAASPFFLVISTSTWSVVLFMVLLSLGEAIWSPRLYDYTMSIAPEGREASFSALAALPLFAAKIPVGMLSGYLLHAYLPEGQSEKEDQRQGRTMWLIIGLLTLSSPILITLCERCIREPDRPSQKKRQGQENSKRQRNRQGETDNDEEAEEESQRTRSDSELPLNPVHQQQQRLPKNAFTILSTEEEGEEEEEEASPLEFEVPVTQSSGIGGSQGSLVVKKSREMSFSPPPVSTSASVTAEETREDIKRTFSI